MSKQSLYVKRSRDQQRVQFYADGPTRINLNQLAAFYAQHLGKDVSRSLLMRRAVEGLLEHVHSLRTEQEIRDETMILLRQAI